MWEPKKWCFWTVVLKKTLESPLNCKAIQPVHPKEISPEYSLERLMLKLQYFGHLMQRADSLEKTMLLGRIDGRKRWGWQDEMVEWHHQLNGHELEHTPVDGEGQGSLACCSPWGCKELDMTEWTELIQQYVSVVLLVLMDPCPTLFPLITSLLSVSVSVSLFK